MIVYQADKRQFVRDTFHDDIEAVLSQQYLRTTGRQPSPSEFNAWKHSLFEVGEVLKDPGIPDDIGVALEYTVPQTSKRIDVLLTGEDEAGTPKLVIIELKQWSEARLSEKDGIIWARRGDKAGETEGPHPSYQAWSYAALLNDFNTAVYEGGVASRPAPPARLPSADPQGTRNCKWYLSEQMVHQDGSWHTRGWRSCRREPWRTSVH